MADEEFDKIVKKFHCLEKHLNIFLKDLADYTKKAEVSLLKYHLKSRFNFL